MNVDDLTVSKKDSDPIVTVTGVDGQTTDKKVSRRVFYVFSKEVSSYKDLVDQKVTDNEI